MAVINTNYLALVSQNNLTKSQSALGQAIERLSSGLRINSAKDDAAGQAIANRFTANIKGLTQAARNANDGISIAQTTEGSLNEINNNLQRIRELSVQAANGTNSQSDLDSIQAEIQQRLDEIDRVSSQTQFNSVRVLAQNNDLTVQVGANDNETIKINLKEITSATLGLGTFNINSSIKTDALSDITSDISGIGSTTTKGTTETVSVQANSFQGATTPPTGSGITAVLNGGGGIDVYSIDLGPNAGGYAIEASDGKFYEVTENQYTGQWFWDSSDANTVIDQSHLSANPVSYTAVEATANTTTAGVGFTDGAGNAGANVTLAGIVNPFSGDISGIDLTNAGAGAEVEGIYYDGANNQYYAHVTGGNDDGFYQISVDANGAATGSIVDSTDAGFSAAQIGTQFSAEIDGTSIDVSGSGGGAVQGIYYDSANNQYYAHVTGGNDDGYYQVSVDVNGNATGTIVDQNDAGFSGAQPGGSAAVTHTFNAGTPAAVDIDFDAGLFARNDINNAASSNQNGDTLTQQYAALGNDGNYYAVEATFTLIDPANQGSTNLAHYDVSFKIDVSAGTNGQISEQNVDVAGGALQELTVAQDGVIAPLQNDLYNKEYTIEIDTSGQSSTGLYQIVDGGGQATGDYAVLGTDGNYYKAELAVDGDGNYTGVVNWTTDPSDANYGLIDAANIDANTDVVNITNDDVITITNGSYTGLGTDQALVSYQDADGNTQYLIQTGTGANASYVKAELGVADPNTGDVAVTAALDANGEEQAVSVLSGNPLAALDKALAQVDDLRSGLGAIQNRFESTIANLNNTVANLSAARSRIEDADYAVEVSNMTRAQILQQAGTAVLAQANQVPQTMLSLLR